MLLAGDIGGTNTRIALYSNEKDRPVLLKERSTPTADTSSLEEAIEGFLSASLDPSGRREIRAACFSLAGPIVNDECQFVNTGLRVSLASLKGRFPDIPKISICNDLVAMGSGLMSLRADELQLLTPKDAAGIQDGTIALLAPGTGLGEAFIIGGNVHPSEGSHTEFGPRSELEYRLLQHLRNQFGHVSYERIVSGPGLENIYGFVTKDKPGSDRIGAQEISRRALVNSCPICLQTLDIFLSVLGAEAGNLALKVSALGGVILGGGILQEILPAMGTFKLLQAFYSKGRYSDYMHRLPVHLILNNKTALLGAALIADSL